MPDKKPDENPKPVRKRKPKALSLKEKENMSAAAVAKWEDEEMAAQRAADKAESRPLRVSVPPGCTHLYLGNTGPYEPDEDGRVKIPQGFLKEAMRYGCKPA